MDASIMEGSELKAGAVCAVKNIKNPVSLAREVMQHSEHVFLCGEGAEQFARERNVMMKEDEYFFNEDRYRQLEEARSKNILQLDHAGEKKFGTVGAVAIDAAGNLAAATSTGGITNKKFGRVGDTPLIGPAPMRNNQTCAISCTVMVSILSGQ
jgi:beta-aspartyl-peptidase (threonine type)